MPSNPGLPAAESDSSRHKHPSFSAEMDLLIFVLGSDVVFTTRREDINDVTLFDCRRLVFYPTTHNETVSRAQIETLSRAFQSQMPRDHKNDLFMRMAVRRAHPAFFHTVFGKKQL